MKTITIIFVAISLIVAQIIPSNNRIDWTPGVPNGIPNITSPMVNVVTDFSADNTGATDASSAIKDAVSSLGLDGGVIYLPAGTYRVIGSIEIGKDNIVLRGDGAEKTKLLFENIETNKACISIITYGRGDWQDVISGYTKDATTLTVTDGSKFTVGQFAEIQQENDSSFMYTKPEWNQDWAQNLIGQLMEVKEVNGNEVTFKTALHITYQSKFNPIIRPQRFVTKVGIENIYAELTTKNDASIIFFKNAAYGWVKDVETYHTLREHVGSESAFGCEVRDSYFHRSWDYGGGGHGYGVMPGFHTTDWLVENNIFDSTRHAMLVQQGANGNVFSYNYSQNALQGDGEENLNQGWFPPDISSHGHYPYMNLFEGNRVNHIALSDYWGPPGPGNTYFRNRVVTDEMSDGITSADSTIHQNVIANSADTIEDRHYYGHFADNLVHGNTIDGVLQWSDTVAEHTLPNSYYLTEKPTFFGDLPWPVFGPVEGYESKLPAQYRFEGEEIPVALETSSSQSNVKVKVTINQKRINFINTLNSKEITLYTVRGREVLHQNISGMKSVSLNTSTLSRGTYLIRLSGKTDLTKKIVLQ